MTKAIVMHISSEVDNQSENSVTNNNENDQQILQEAISRIDTVEFLPLSPHYPKLNAFSSFIGWIVIFAALLAVNLLADEVILHFTVLPGVVFLALISAVYGFYFAKSCGYYKGEFDLLYKEGLWWKKQTALSFSRIQHIDISHGPLERRYNMATIKFFTAGGVASDLKIPGLPNELAESLRTEILQYAKTEYETSNTKKQQEEAVAINSQNKVEPETNNE